MSKEDKLQNDGAIAFYKQVSVRLMEMEEQVNDNVADRGMMRGVISEFHKFLWNEIKHFIGKEIEPLKKERDEN